MKTTTKNRQKLKIQNSSRKCRSQLNHKLFSENFIFDPFKIFAKPLGTINIRVIR